MKSLRSRLLITISLILLITQVITILWVWYESEELIELYVKRIIASDHINLQAIDKAIHAEILETMAALFLPAVMMLLIVLVVTSLAINYLTRPLHQLAKAIAEKTPYDLSPLQIKDATSELVTVEKSVNQLLYRLGQAIDNERRFTADVAHELRTPLAGLRLNLELFEASGVPEAGKLINRIDQMMVSIEQLLQLARAGQKLLEGKAQRFNLIDEVIIPLRDEWEDQISATCSIHWLTPESIEMNGDSGLIYLMFRNLLDNVRSYAAEGECVIVRLLHQGNSVIIEVIDEGPGVVPEKIPSLVQRFTRVDQARHGHGLGLNIVHRIVMTHQGTLDIKNRMDRSGLHITICLPIS